MTEAQIKEYDMPDHINAENGHAWIDFLKGVVKATEHQPGTEGVLFFLPPYACAAIDSAGLALGVLPPLNLRNSYAMPVLLHEDFLVTSTGRNGVSTIGYLDLGITPGKPALEGTYAISSTVTVLDMEETWRAFRAAQQMARTFQYALS